MSTSTEPEAPSATCTSKECKNESCTRKPKAISWYRTKIDTTLLKSLHERSDWHGARQTLLYLGLLVLTGSITVYSGHHGPIWITFGLLLVHGTFFAFLINATHELIHNTVFKTKALNRFFAHLTGFLGWNNFEYFDASHLRHHRYTLHQPDDLEVTLPQTARIKYFLIHGIIDFTEIPRVLREAARLASGQFSGEWEKTLFSEDLEARKRVINFARFTLFGHTAITLICLYCGWWMVPVVLSGGHFFGRALFFACNGTQHVGLVDETPDFRLCCRTFTMNPFLEFLYWHMNYHTEHHMYAAVPCYHLKALHQAIKHDLPPVTHGLVSTWKDILEIQRRQDEDPSYRYVAPLPNSPARQHAMA